jgi:hypothetical protein
MYLIVQWAPDVEWDRLTANHTREPSLAEMERLALWSLDPTIEWEPA